jgi:hypothetical protein
MVIKVVSIGCLTNALGLAHCPLELGTHFRLHDGDQPEGDWRQPARQHQAPSGSLTIATIAIASVPLTPDDALPKGFYVQRIQGDLWLCGYRAGPGHGWAADDPLLFCQALGSSVYINSMSPCHPFISRSATQLLLNV